MKTVKPTILTFEDHQEIGQILTRWDKESVHVLCKLLNGFPKSKRIHRNMQTIIKNITQLQNFLDFQVTSDEAYDNYPGKTHEERLSAYFGPIKESEN